MSVKISIDFGYVGSLVTLVTFCCLNIVLESGGKGKFTN